VLTHKLILGTKNMCNTNTNHILCLCCTNTNLILGTLHYRLTIKRLLYNLLDLTLLLTYIPVSFRDVVLIPLHCFTPGKASRRNLATFNARDARAIMSGLPTLCMSHFLLPTTPWPGN
jgi:hypothetical protein